MHKLGFIKVAMATPKVYLGHPLENAKEIINIYNENKKADIIVYPELSVTGYSIGDWVYNFELLSKTSEAIQYIKENSEESILVVGAPFALRGAIYNCAVVIQHKKILGIIPKISLPNTDVFIEERHYTSGKEYANYCEYINYLDEVVPFGHQVFEDEKNNFRFGVEICADLWAQTNPHDLLFKEGSDIVLNISGSTFHLGKNQERLNMVNAVSKKYSAAYIYVSNGPSDSTSDVTYSGHQIASINGEDVLNKETLSLNTVVNLVDIDLEYIKFLKFSTSYAKKENLVANYITKFHLNFDKNFKLESRPIYDPFVPKTKDEFERIIEVAGIALKHRLDYIGINKVILGVSGGLDSTLVLLFAYLCYKKYNLNLKNIIGVTMPGLGTGSKSRHIANNLMEKLEIDAREISIKKEALVHLKTIKHNLETKDVTYENVQARLRTMYLMNIANKEGAIVLGTGDMSEIALGWSTFNGDQISMYNLNANLPKTVIKAMVKYLAEKYPFIKKELMKVHGAVITPELTGSDQSTEDRVGKYLINDFMMYHIFTRGASKDKIVYLLQVTFDASEAEAVQYYERFMYRFKHNQFKRYASAESIKYFSFGLGARLDYIFPGDMK